MWCRSKAGLLRLRGQAVVSLEEQKPVERLVDRILAAKARDASADVSAPERELDELVHAFHALTPAGIQLVEDAQN